jgi:hypothetical protein
MFHKKTYGHDGIKIVSFADAVSGIVGDPIIAPISGMINVYVYFTVTMTSPPEQGGIALTLTVTFAESYRSTGVGGGGPGGPEAPRTRLSIAPVGKIDPYNAPSWAASRMAT